MTSLFTYRYNILFIAPFPPPIHGASTVSQMIRDSKLINNEFKCYYVSNSSATTVSNIGKVSVSKAWMLVKSFLTILWILLTKHIDVCYLAITCAGKGFLKDAPFVLLCKMFRKKIVIHQHNKGMSLWVDKKPYKWVYPLVYCNVKVMMLSWLLYPDVEKVVKREQVLVCPNGIPQTNFEIIERHNSVPRILFLSNLIISKGVYVLLDACKILKDKGIQFHCDFVGAESKEISTEQFNTAVVERGLQDMVTYHGRKYSSDKDLFWRNADIFAFPSFYHCECFPLVLLEAMQYQLPVVTTNEGGIQDEVQDGVNGLVSERQNAESLALAIERLLQDCELRKRLGKKGYELYLQKFTVEVFERNLRDCLLKVNNENG